MYFRLLSILTEHIGFAPIPSASKADVQHDHTHDISCPELMKLQLIASENTYIL
jgi:hypothetical protein